MSYFVPYIDESGYHYPTYMDVLTAVVEDMQRIYGAGIYLGMDSPEYQMLAQFAQYVYDTYQACQAAYNSHSPASAIGTALDYIVAVNGVTRKQSTKSYATVVLTGAVGTVITNGIVADESGHLWDIPSPTTIDDVAGTSVLATCRESGVVVAAAGAIDKIMTPTDGWLAVTNPAAATTGAAVETDAELRVRQARSVAQASQGVVAGLEGALLAVKNVTRARVWENSTGSTNSQGIPAHSICAVVEGGESEDIGKAILFHKSCGCGTYGSTSVTVYDSDDQQYSIQFDRAQQKDIDVAISLTRKSGYKNSTESLITAAVVDYINTYGIGESFQTSMLWYVAQKVNAETQIPTYVITSIGACVHGGTPSAADVSVPYNAVAHGSVANVSITVS